MRLEKADGTVLTFHWHHHRYSPTMDAKTRRRVEAENLANSLRERKNKKLAVVVTVDVLRPATTLTVHPNKCTTHPTAERIRNSLPICDYVASGNWPQVLSAKCYFLDEPNREVAERVLLEEFLRRNIADFSYEDRQKMWEGLIAFQNAPRELGRRVRRNAFNLYHAARAVGKEFYAGKEKPDLGNLIQLVNRIDRKTQTQKKPKPRGPQPPPAVA